MTSLVSLRKLETEDALCISELANNKKIACNLRDRFPNPYTLNDAINFLEIMKDEQKLINFAICYKGDFVGIIGLIPQDDIYRFSAEMGYWVGETFWNKGIASDAVSQIIEYAKNSSPLIRIYASAFDYNIASQMVLMKNGFDFDCIAIKAVYKEGRIIDEYRYSYIFEEKIISNM